MATGDVGSGSTVPIIKRGSVFFTNVGNNSTAGSGTISFGITFPGTPTVVVGMTGMNNESSLNNGIWCTAEDISTTSFRIVVCGGGLGSNDMSVAWIAVYVP